MDMIEHERGKPHPTNQTHPEPMFDIEETTNVSRGTASREALDQRQKDVQEVATELNRLIHSPYVGSLAPSKYVLGLLWTTHGRFVGRVKLNYGSQAAKDATPLAAARHAFYRSYFEQSLGVNASDLAGHILIVPEPPYGDTPVMVK